MWTSVPGFGDQVLGVAHGEVDLPLDHVEGLVPGVAVGRWAAAFGSALTEDLVAAGLLGRGEHRDLFADHVQWRRRLIG